LSTHWLLKKISNGCTIDCDKVIQQFPWGRPEIHIRALESRQRNTGNWKIASQARRRDSLISQSL